MITDSYPNFEEFLAAPIEEVAKVAPATLIFSPGGTRRSAVFAGISPSSEDYFKWSLQKIMSCFDLIFKHGVRHILAVVVTPNNLNEVTKEYGTQVVKRTNSTLARPDLLAKYAHFGWRVRLIGSERASELKATAKRLEEATPLHNSSTVWFTVTLTDDSPWEDLLAVAQRTQAQTRQDIIQALYGEEIPPATLLLSFGKPQILSGLVPPILIGNLQCYWMQKPGYDLDQHTLRTILYDYAYLRKTWRRDKTGRAEKALKHRTTWEQGPTIGLGMRLGPFWYPAPIFPPLKEQA